MTNDGLVVSLSNHKKRGKILDFFLCFFSTCLLYFSQAFEVNKLQFEESLKKPMQLFGGDV